MSTKIDQIQKQGDVLFENRGQLMSLWQEIAENFYPERADFTATRTLGEEFASNLDTSYPILARRDLGNQIGGMLRPTNKEWFSLIRQYDDDKLDLEGRAWLEWATKLMKRAMYDPIAMFARATKEADHDWSAFGQCVLSRQLNLKVNRLLFRCWHLKDVAWQEDEVGQIGTVYRKWKPTAITLSRFFPKKIHKKVSDCLDKEPYKEFDVYHMVIPSDIYPDSKFKRFPYVSVYYDIENKQVMEEINTVDCEYIIPRWQTVSGSQYAFSPATVAALPDARLIQAMARILLDAGEKAVTPPMLAVQEAIRGDVSVYAGGITWVDREYDERLGEVLREMKQGGNLPIGFELNDQTKQIIAEAFYLNKLTLPPPDREMTAYETGQRVQEYIRQALPLFEPMEVEYNGQVCEKTFALMLRIGAFGDPRTMPKSLQGANVSFQFESPLKEATERAKGQRFLESGDMIASAMQLDPNARHVVDPIIALRDVLSGIGVPAKWQRDDTKVEELIAQDAEAAQAAQMVALAQQGSEAVKNLGGMEQNVA